MRNVLILGITVSAMAAAAILLSGCATSPAERHYQVLPGPPVPGERAVIEAPEASLTGDYECITKATPVAGKTSGIKKTSGRTPNGLARCSRQA